MSGVRCLIARDAFVLASLGDFGKPALLKYVLLFTVSVFILYLCVQEYPQSL